MEQIDIANTTVYTCPSNNTSRIIKCTATNDTTTSVTLSVNKVPSGGSVSDTNLILNLKVLGSRETYECPEVVGQVLDAGDIISMIASVVSQVTVSLDVVEMT